MCMYPLNYASFVAFSRSCSRSLYQTIRRKKRYTVFINSLVYHTTIGSFWHVLVIKCVSFSQQIHKRRLVYTLWIIYLRDSLLYDHGPLLDTKVIIIKKNMGNCGNGKKRGAKVHSSTIRNWIGFFNKTINEGLLSIQVIYKHVSVKMCGGKGERCNVSENINGEKGQWTIKL